MKWVRSHDRLPTEADMYRPEEHMYFILAADIGLHGETGKPGHVGMIQGETPEDVIQQLYGFPDDPGGYWWASIEPPPVTG